MIINDNLNPPVNLSLGVKNPLYNEITCNEINNLEFSIQGLLSFPKKIKLTSTIQILCSKLLK